MSINTTAVQDKVAFHEAYERPSVSRLVSALERNSKNHSTSATSLQWVQDRAERQRLLTALIPLDGCCPPYGTQITYNAKIAATWHRTPCSSKRSYIRTCYFHFERITFINLTFLPWLQHVPPKLLTRQFTLSQSTRTPSVAQ